MGVIGIREAAAATDRDQPRVAHVTDEHWVDDTSGTGSCRWYLEAGK